MLEKKFLLEIEDKTKKEIEKYINNLINFNKEHDTDLLGLKNIIYKKHNKEYKNYKDKNIYDIADFNIKINVYLYKYGNTYRSFSGGAHE